MKDRVVKLRSRLSWSSVATVLASLLWIASVVALVNGDNYMMYVLLFWSVLLHLLVTNSHLRRVTRENTEYAVLLMRWNFMADGMIRLDKSRKADLAWFIEHRLDDDEDAIVRRAAIERSLML